MGMHTKKWIHSIRFHMGACILGFLMVHPFLWLLAGSFKSNDTMFLDTYSPVSKTQDGTTNYKSGSSGVGGIRFIAFFTNPLVVTVADTAGCVITSLFVAYALSRIKFRFSGFWFGCVMLTMVIPLQVMVVPQYIIPKRLHLINTRTVLVLPRFFSGVFFISPMVQLFQGISRELDEVAEIGGCGKLAILSRILIPIVKPAIVTSSTFALYWAWQDFSQPLIFMNSISKFTIPPALNMYLDPSSYNNYGGLFTTSMISLLPVIIFLIIFQRYLVDGTAMDGIKGQETFVLPSWGCSLIT